MQYNTRDYDAKMNQQRFDRSRSFSWRTLATVLVLAQERYSGRQIGNLLGLSDGTVYYIAKTYGRNLSFLGERNNLSGMRSLMKSLHAPVGAKPKLKTRPNRHRPRTLKLAVS
jgi:hypothetical protein